MRADRIRKSIGGERTFNEDLVADTELREALEGIIGLVWERIEGHGARGRTVTLKVKYADFRQVTRARSVQRAIDGRERFAAVAHALLEALLPVGRGVRLLGLTLSSLEARRDTPRAQAAVAEAMPEQQPLF